MSDTITSTKTASMTIEFTDGDTRTITQNNPITNTTNLIAAINDFSTYCRENNILIGDKAGGSYSRITEAKIIERSTMNLDLGL